MDEGRQHNPVPVLLVTGVLGAGKTTLINSILQADHGRVLAAVVNDFGSVDIDAAILSATGQPIYGLTNGCICCSLQGDLLRTLRSILSLHNPPDGIVIEASGISFPSGIIEALFDPVLCEAVRLDAVVAVVDAEEYDPADDLWKAQLRAADFVVLSKTATVESRDVASLRAVLSALHKNLVFDSTGDRALPIDLFFGGGFARERSLDRISAPHVADERFVRLEWSCLTPVSLPRFQSAIQVLAPQLARAKGFLSVEGKQGQGYLFQLVGQRASMVPAAKPFIGTQLVLIGPTELFDIQQAKSVLTRLESGDDFSAEVG
ncbi:CobW family GTP-binding protein [Mesorhizobium sp. CO1-1-8]|uniref:CobW family GTP-binding protein n=1 Tax=Mesorhizobium sp. CO1-1-8 TaxID=2876631 RepID=UPI001CD12553|nr:GTP-binding protein [Mesorhizobium sp. CO1-1-8]MBZ9772185.1 GTP-binding protein [Mesorhizobium sp. CO1-1-8]